MQPADLESLVAKLNDPSNEVADDAVAELLQIGAAVLPAVVAAIPTLTSGGKTGAIEVMDGLQDPAAGPALTGLLHDGNDLVREWSARALSRVPYLPAGEVLIALHRRLMREGVPPGWTEPVAVRDALNAVGLRSPVWPRHTRHPAERSAPISWPLSELRAVFEDLAAHRQLILYWQSWRWADLPGSPDRKRFLYLDADARKSTGWQYDPKKPWLVNVEDARQAAELELQTTPSTESALATAEWADREDVLGWLGLQLPPA